MTYAVERLLHNTVIFAGGGKHETGIKMSGSIGKNCDMSP